MNYLAAGSRLQHNVAELLRRCETPADIDRRKKVGLVRGGLSSKLACGNLDVLFPNRIDNIAGGNTAGCQAIRVKPDPHRVIARAGQLYVANAGQTREFVLDVQYAIVAQVEGVMLPVLRVQTDIHQRRGRLLLSGHAILAHFIGQSGKCLADTVLYTDGGGVRVNTRTEGHDNLNAAV